MKTKIFTTLVLFVMASGALLAQNPSRSYDKDKLDAARVAFITNRLDLKPDQAEKFWPVFNAYNEERNQVMRELSQINRSGAEGVDEKKAKEMIHKRFELQQILLDSEKEFMEDVLKILQPTQALKLGGVNREFTKQVFRMQRGRNSN